MKRCDQCHEDFAEGTGVTEHTISGARLIEERFCSDSCADEYESDMDDLDSDSEDDD